MVYTDNESWAGDVHLDQALNDYRQRMGIPAKLLAVPIIHTAKDTGPSTRRRGFKSR